MSEHVLHSTFKQEFAAVAFSTTAAAANSTTTITTTTTTFTTTTTSTTTTICHKNTRVKNSQKISISCFRFYSFLSSQRKSWFMGA